MKITAEYLTDKGVYEEELEYFAAMWGTEFEVTQETCMEAARLGLPDISAAVFDLLPDDKKKEIRDYMWEYYFRKRKQYMDGQFKEAWRKLAKIVTDCPLKEVCGG